MDNSDDFEEILQKLGSFASKDFVNFVRTALIYSPPITFLPYPMRIVLNHLSQYAVDSIYDKGSEEKLMELFQNDFLTYLDKVRKEYEEQHPLSKTLQQVPYQQMTNARTFKGFEPNRHIIFFGSTTAGKTTEFIREMLTQGIFTDFEQFLLVDTGLKQDMTQNIFKAAAHNMRVERKMEKDDKQLVYYKPHQVKEAIHHLAEVDRDKKKLAFFDDVQVQANKKDWVELSKFFSVAKNANVQLCIALHHGFDKGEEIQIRSAAGYYVMMNVENRMFNTLLGLQGSDNAEWKAFTKSPDKYERVAIYDKDNKKLYNKDFGDMIPLLNNHGNRNIDMNNTKVIDTSGAIPQNKRPKFE